MINHSTNSSYHPVVTISDMSKSFGDRQILDRLSMELFSEENLVILGKSGAGKSVLIKCLAGLIHPDAGRVSVLGRDIVTLDEHGWADLRLQIGFSFQMSALYDSMTIYDNLAFPLRRTQDAISESEVKYRVDEMLNEVGLSYTSNHYPSELSGGMQKRIGIARTLILNPKIMLYDEPTSGLDPDTASDINDLILHVREKYNTSSIIITHDLSCAEATSDRVIGLFDGTNKVQGTFSELKNNPPKELRSFFNYIDIKS